MQVLSNWLFWRRSVSHEQMAVPTGVQKHGHFLQNYLKPLHLWGVGGHSRVQTRLWSDKRAYYAVTSWPLWRACINYCCQLHWFSFVFALVAQLLNSFAIQYGTSVLYSMECWLMLHQSLQGLHPPQFRTQFTSKCLSFVLKKFLTI